MNLWQWMWRASQPGPQPQPQPTPQPSPARPRPLPAPAPTIPATGGGWTMLVCEADGTIATVRNGLRTALPIGGQSASWSLATSGIIYALAGQIWIADADGRNPRRAGNVTNAVMPQQAKNGSIVFMGDRGGAFLVNDDGSRLMQALLPPNTGAPGAPMYMQPALSPDSARIAFVKQTDGPYQRQVWSMDIRTGVQRQETSRDGVDLLRPDANAPMYMPNGDLVCFNGVEANQHPGDAPQSVFTLGQRDILLVPTDGSLRRILTRTYPVRSQAELEALPDGTFIMADNPSPSPDGQWVIFDAQVWRSSERAVRAVTGIVNIDGTGQRVYYPHERGVVRVALR